ncbi:MAG: site-specific integrase [Myxococcota bacterium]
MRVGHGVGLSVEDRGGRWLLRWRQNEVQPDGTTKRVQRTRMCFTVEELRSKTAEIEAALRDCGWWRPPEEARPGMPVVPNAEAAALDWLAWKVGTRGAAANTRGNLARSMKRFFGELRQVVGLAEEAAVPVTAMTAANVNAVTARWKDRYAEGTVYQTIAAVVDMWTWIADDPDRYPDVPRPPYNKDRVLPTTPSYEAPEAVPTWAETDACLRRIRLPFPRRMATIMRYTGLRLEQAAMVHREDFDLANGTLLIRKGKSRREKALMRRVAVSRHLVADLGTWLTDHEPGPLFPDARVGDDGGVVPIRTYRNQTRYVTEAWEAATAAEEARKEVWAPPNRKKNRPDHAFRASFQAALEANGYGEALVDWLVGHAPKTTRGKHYARPAENILRAAVDSIPAIDWRESRDNVVPLRRRARE